jgi:protease secretion system membrane fusion protein
MAMHIAPSFEKAMPAAGDEAPTDVGSAIRKGVLLLAIGFGGFLAWSLLVPLDEGVPAPAVIVLDQHSTQIQHPTGGVVHAVAVREGQMVRSGDVLIQLNDVGSRASLDATRIEWISLRAQEARLLAEQVGAAEITYPSGLQALRDDATAGQQMALQRDLFLTRKRALASELATMGQQLAAAEAGLVGLRESLQAREQQQALFEQELQSTRQLVGEGFMPRTRQSDLERQLADVRANTANLRGNVARSIEALAEIRLRQQQRQQEYRREVETQLADVRRDAASRAERLKSVSDDQERTTLRAPVGGQVVGLTVQRPGGVAAPGAKLMEIVPEQQKLVLEAQIPPHLIDTVHAGLPADINLHGFVSLPRLVVPGRVVTVSNSALTDPQTRSSYYLARVEVLPEAREQLQGRVLQPGMPADVVVKTGERTLLNYLLRPLLKRLSQSLKEA